MVDLVVVDIIDEGGCVSLIFMVLLGVFGE